MDAILKDGYFTDGEIADLTTKNAGAYWESGTIRATFPDEATLEDPSAP